MLHRLYAAGLFCSSDDGRNSFLEIKKLTIRFGGIQALMMFLFR
jgi:hypothetical protein